ncbi:MAG: HTH domain-containing protein [Nitrospirae bacterium]|nr:HTH domain-containing protein [Nitrospirota bacterium]
MAERSRKDVDREKKLHRLLSILRNLDIRQQCTPKILAQEFGTTERNIYRDLNDLDAAGFSITFDREYNTYRFTDSDFSLRDLNLNSGELTALLVGQQLSHNLGKPSVERTVCEKSRNHAETSSWLTSVYQSQPKRRM